MITVTYTLLFDHERLDEIARGLYEGPPDDPVRGEPHPGLQLVRDWVAEAEAHASKGGIHLGHIDTLPWQDAVQCTITVHAPGEPPPPANPAQPTYSS